MREIRRYDGEASVVLPTSLCPSSQGSRGYPKDHDFLWYDGRFGDMD